MKKQMRDENLMRISEKADRSVTDTSVASILLCYLLHRVEQPLDAELLYEIAVSGGIINYFTYQDALASMTANGSVAVHPSEKGEQIYTLLPKGVACAKRLKTFAAKSYRDHIVVAAQKAIMRKNNQDDVKLDYLESENGCYLRVQITDHGISLLDLTVFTPDLQQAHALGNRILDNPPAFYNGVMQAALQNEAPPVDLTDN